MSGPRVRFAPSPTGSLHLGNARTALFNWLVARGGSGTFLLRIEDTDTAREREGSEESILADLRWLGLDWDEGLVRQSERLPLYAEAASSLVASGAAFPCFCSARSDDEPRTAGHRDPCRSIPPDEAKRRADAGEAHAVRLRVPGEGEGGDAAVRFDDRLRGPIAIPLAQLPDALLVRPDGRPTYNFAAAVDDGAMKIDLVIRGDDHLTNTAVQILVVRGLGGSLPEFAHLPMVLGADGERLSKRHGAASVGSWRERGVPPEALVNALALLGWSPAGGETTLLTREELVATFDLDRVGRAPAVFDPAKLEWISSQHIRGLARDRLAAEVGARLAAAGLVGEDDVSLPWIGDVAELLRPTLATFDQVPARVEPLFHPGGPLDEPARVVLAAPAARGVVQALVAELARTDVVDAAAWSALKDAIQEATKAKGKALFQPLRVALTGREHGRELDRVVPLARAGHLALPDRVPSLRSRAERTLSELP
ncbi:MAG TPA: glutamate--tRNA ligase [Candidatus Polarisedimenticolaceae bacterium]|nr:glutamate--tRNA ligase [Candidatus Polarisedimenticolaceae bacterium]